MGIRRTKSDELDIFGQEPETATNDIEKAESSGYLQQRNERIELLLIQNMEAIKSLSLEVKDLSNSVKTIEKTLDTMPYNMGKEIADGLKNARFMGKLDSETYTKLKDISHEALLEQDAVVHRGYNQAFQILLVTVTFNFHRRSTAFTRAERQIFIYQNILFVFDVFFCLLGRNLIKITIVLQCS